MQLIFFIIFIISAGISSARADELAQLRAADSGNWAQAMPSQSALIRWMYLQDRDNDASFSQIQDFLRAHPGWPNENRLILRAEQAMNANEVSVATLGDWFAKNTPISGYGKYAKARFLLATGGAKQDPAVARLIREAWVSGDFDLITEQKIADEFASLLDPETNDSRMDRLLWENKLKPAQRLMPMLNESQVKLAQARMDLQRNDAQALTAARALSDEQQRQPGLMFDRAQFLVRNDDKDAAREILIQAPEQVPYSKRWWKLREPLIRAALDDGQLDVAAALLRNHGQTETMELSEARWLQGWLNLEFRKAPGEALKAFSQMYDDVRFPISRARSAYWAGRAAREDGQEEAANSWFTRAAQFTTTFYGQEAALALGAKAPEIKPLLQFTPQDPPLPASTVKEILLAAHQCEKAGLHKLAATLLIHLVEHAPSAQAATQYVLLGKKWGSPYLSVRTAKRAAQLGLVLVEEAYPRIPTPSQAEVPRPLILALVRQESEFDPAAKSPAGAIGLMQLLPGTAKEVARKNSVHYHAGILTKPETNVLLGSYYFAHLLNRPFLPDPVMAVAAYNAGPGRVYQWVQAFGTPGDSRESVIRWIEMIPYSETRTYVQRVTENWRVYQSLVGENAP